MAKTKEEKAISRKEREEKSQKLTSWFMLVLTYGFIAIMLTIWFKRLEIGKGFENFGLAQKVFLGFGILSAVFALATVILGMMNKISTPMAKGHTIMFVVMALVCIWLNIDVYGAVRMGVMNMFRGVPSIYGFINALNTNWRFDVVVWGVGIYLIISFIYYIIKLALIDKK